MDPKPRDLLRSTDTSVKTTEAWWSFIKAVWEDGKPFLAGFLGGSGVIGGALNSLFSWIADYGWAGWVFAGVAGFVSACVLALLISAVWYVALLVRDRRHGRTAQRPQSSAEPRAADLPDWLPTVPGQLNALKESIGNLGKSFVSAEQPRSSSIDSLRSQIELLTGRLTAIEESLRPKPTGVLSGFQPVDRLAGLEARIDEVREAFERRLSDIDAAIADARENHRLLHDRTHDVFRAKQVEAEMDRLLAEISAVDDALSAPSLQPHMEIDFERWRHQYRHYRELLSILTRVVSPYFRLEPELSTIDPEKFKSDGWSFRQDRFPNSDLVHDYKTFRLIANNLERLKQPMKFAVLSASRV